MLTLLLQAETTLALPKSHFLQKKIENLGNIVMPGGLAAASRNAHLIKTVFFSAVSPLVRSILVRLNVYRRFIKKFSKSARPHNFTYGLTRNWTGQTLQLRIYMPFIR